MTISEVGRQAGIRSSTIRYYEQIGVLQPAQRVSGQRRYDNTVLYRLAIIQRAQQTGFTLDEVRRLFYGFREKTPISERWRKLSEQKLKELEQMVEQIETMQELLLRIQKCRCDAIESCGKAMFDRQSGEVCAEASPKPRKRRSSISIPRFPVRN
ncbi:MAG: MerR family transcriptional regulator [Terriglobales bacterium]|jgi:MerR family redox-sensitive transcriptional activator SoxR